MLQLCLVRCRYECWYNVSMTSVLHVCMCVHIPNNTCPQVECDRVWHSEQDTGLSRMKQEGEEVES